MSREQQIDALVKLAEDVWVKMLPQEEVRKRIGEILDVAELAALTASPQAAPGYTASQVAKAWRMAGLFPDATLGKVLENLERLASPQAVPEGLPLAYEPRFRETVERAIGQEYTDRTHLGLADIRNIVQAFASPQAAPGVDALRKLIEELREDDRNYADPAADYAIAIKHRIANKIEAALASGPSGVDGWLIYEDDLDDVDFTRYAHTAERAKKRGLNVIPVSFAPTAQDQGEGK